MKMLRFWLILATLGFAGLRLMAQEPAASGTQPIYLVVKHDGTEFVGKLLHQDAREVLLRTKEMGEVIIPKHEIAQMRPISAEELNQQGEYIPPEAFGTRYFLTTNGLASPKGQHYMQINLFGPDFQFAVSDRVNVGLMTSWIGAPLIGTAKVSIPLSPKLHLGLGGLAGIGSWVSWDMGLALPFAALTLGDQRANLNFCAGYGAVFLNGEANGRALLSVGGMARVGKNLSLVFDSFIMPPQSNEINGFTEGFAVLSPGFRWQATRRGAFQFGVAALSFDGEFVPVPIPMLQWYQRLN